MIFGVLSAAPAVPAAPPATAFLYQPRGVVLADVIPFYWKGDFHILYLQLKPGQKDSTGRNGQRDFVSSRAYGRRHSRRRRGRRHRDIFTGSVIAATTCLCLLTGHNHVFVKQGKADQVILRAASRDGVHGPRSQPSALARERPAIPIPGWLPRSVCILESRLPRVRHALLRAATLPAARRCRRLCRERNCSTGGWKSVWASGRFPGYEYPTCFGRATAGICSFPPTPRTPAGPRALHDRGEPAGTSPAMTFSTAVYAAKSVSDGTRPLPADPPREG